jgi:CubicO group peptidase (beta-lactamase class C family)
MWFVGLVAAACRGEPAPPDGADDPWAAVDRQAQETFEAQGIAGMGLAIYNAQDEKCFEQMYGDFAPDREVAVASASKMVAGTVIFDVIRRGLLSLDSTTGDVLGWTGAKGTITLRHLLSFTSGLAPDAACTLNPTITLAACVATISAADALAAPGAEFRYGSVHLAVAGRMAEVATDEPWNQLFVDTLARPLGLPASVTYYTFPRQALGMMNPLVAGGMRASMNDYARLFATVFHRGSYRGLTIGTPALFDQQAIDPYPSSVIQRTPPPAKTHGFRYGLTAWLECETPATGCMAISSPGAFGWTPWMDRARGYYAILGMEVPREDLEDLPEFPVQLAQDLKQLIEAAISRCPR